MGSKRAASSRAGGCSATRALRDGWKFLFVLVLLYTAYCMYAVETQHPNALLSRIDHLLHKAPEGERPQQHLGPAEGNRQLLPKPPPRPAELAKREAEQEEALQAKPAAAVEQREEAKAAERREEARPAPVVATSAATTRPKPQAWPKWVYCAEQWSSCRCRGTIRWGNKDTWHEVEKPDGKTDHSVMCSIDKLPDNLPGDGDKHCECWWTPGDPELGKKRKEDEPVIEAAPAPSGHEWVFCCGQWQECACPGNVRWGNRNKWSVVKLKPDKTEHVVTCSIRNLKDILPGDDGKHCECLVDMQSSIYERINPGLLPESALESKDKFLVASCEKFEAGSRDGMVAGAVLWEAVEGICTDGPSSRGEPRPKVGDRALGLDVRRGLMRAWVEPRFRANYERLFNRSGWAPRGFVNYYAGRSGGKHAKMTEELIRSVHMFSKEPIVVVHFGFTTVESWDPEDFPRLVLLNAPPLPSTAGRSFNFNKLRAMLLARVLVGVELDSDQFVAPGVDAIFERTAQEITRDYPIPIMPAHFLDWGPQDQGPGGSGAKLWNRFCPKGRRANCTGQTARWGHAHPTWTFWAAPFLGRWLGRNYRDEYLPYREDRNLHPLRVLDVGEDEDLLNVGTWEEGGTKTWCKFDLPDPTEFDTWLAKHQQSFWREQMECKKGMCGNIEGDPRFHPKGIAKVFYTAHHAVNPDVTAEYLKKIQKADSLPPPILYDKVFYNDGQELRGKKSQVRCII